MSFKTIKIYRGYPIVNGYIQLPNNLEKNKAKTPISELLDSGALMDIDSHQLWQYILPGVPVDNSDDIINTAFDTYGYGFYLPDGYTAGEGKDLVIINDKIMLAGWLYDGVKQKPGIVKLLTNGDVDTSFANGWAIPDLGDAYSGSDISITTLISVTPNLGLIVGNAVQNRQTFILTLFDSVTGEGGGSVEWPWFDGGALQRLAKDNINTYGCGQASRDGSWGTGVFKTDSDGYLVASFTNIADNGYTFIPDMLGSAICLLTNNNLLVSGTTSTEDQSPCFALVNQTGTILYQVSVLLSNINYNNYGFSASTPLRDGKALLAGSGVLSDYSFGVVYVGRLGADGEMDHSFATSGYCQVLFNSSNDARVSDILVDENSNIIVTGYMKSEVFGGEGGQAYSFFAVKFDSDGNLDTNFGDNGLSSEWCGRETFGYGAGLQNDGKIIIGGYSHTRDWQWVFAASRLKTDGSLDQKTPTSTIFSINGFDTKLIVPNGTVFDDGGFDYFYYPQDEIPSSVTYRGINFRIINTGDFNGISLNTESGLDVAISGNFDDLYATIACSNNVYDNSVVVTYDDASTDTTILNISNWQVPNPYDSEFPIVTTTHMAMADGSLTLTKAKIYAYKIPVNKSKTIVSVHFPSISAHIALLGLTGVTWN